MSSDRLSQAEKQLESLYGQFNEIEDDITNNQNPQARAQSKQQLKNLKPRIQQYEKEYLQALQQQSTELTFVESEAEVIVSAIIQEAEILEATVTYPVQASEMLREILTELRKPGIPASGKLKATIPLLPGFVTYEMELETGGLLRRIFPTVFQILGK